MTSGTAGEGRSTNIVFDDSLVVVCSDRKGAITRIRQYGNLELFQDRGFPMPENTAFHPALSSHGNTLYMFCHNVERQPVILKFTAEQGQAAGENGHWVKVTDVPYHVHCMRTCTMHATSTSITCLGGADQMFTSTNHVSMFSFADKQWTSSPDTSLYPLPGRCAYASIVQCQDSLYIVGGHECVFFQQDAGGRWRQASRPSGENLSFSAACTLSRDCIAIVCNTNAGLKCIVHNVVTREVHQLPRCDIATIYPSLALFNDCLVCSGERGQVWKLDMNV